MLRMLSFLVCVFLLGCGNSQKKDAEVLNLATEDTKTVGKGMVELPVYDFDGLEPLLHREDGKTYVVNFWATWCKPCVEELPYFERITNEENGSNVEVLLISLDMPKMWEKNLIPFIEKHGLQSKVVILDDPKMNDWIPKIDEDWSGGIPATLIYNKNKRTFYELPFTYEKLKKELDAHTKI